jgi:hypothetical protein
VTKEAAAAVILLKNRVLVWFSWWKEKESWDDGRDGRKNDDVRV